MHAGAVLATQLNNVDNSEMNGPLAQLGGAFD